MKLIYSGTSSSINIHDVLPIFRKTRQRAAADPSASPSGFVCVNISIVSAALRKPASSFNEALLFIASPRCNIYSSSSSSSCLISRVLMSSSMCLPYSSDLSILKIRSGTCLSFICLPISLRIKPFALFSASRVSCC